jgi:signal transduction histidine kinase
LREKLIALEVAYQRLLADNAHLAAEVEQGLLLQEELAVFNEELQVSNEELQTQTQACQELEHLNLLKDEFLSLASHELRNPLAVILGHAEFIQMYVSKHGTESGTSLWSEQRQREALHIISTQAKHLSRLIEQMVDVILIRGDVFALQPSTPLDLVSLVRRVIEQYRLTSDSRLLFETEEDTAICPGDAGRIEQVCANLISNALKYSPPPTPVVVTVKRDPTGILAPLALITVQDQGPGIRPDAQDAIFRRYYREPGAEQRYRKGLGLGLYVAHEIVKRHGGRLWVESTVGVGSTFYVALPLAEEMPVKVRTM